MLYMNLFTWIKKQFDTFDWLVEQKQPLQALKNAVHEEITASARLNWSYTYKTLLLGFLLLTDWHVVFATNLANRLSVNLVTAIYTSQILLGVLLLVFVNMLLVEIPVGIILGIWRRLGIYKNQATYKKNKLKK